MTDLEGVDMAQGTEYDEAEARRWSPHPEALAWSRRVFPDLVRQHAAVQAEGRQPRRVVVDYGTVPEDVHGGQILGLPIEHADVLEPRVES